MTPIRSLVLAVALAFPAIGYGQTGYRFAVDPQLNNLCKGFDGSAACADAIEKYQLSKQVRGVARSANRLSIQITGGRRVTLTDRKYGEPEGIGYRYIEYLPSIGFHLVHVQYYEGTEMLLVSNTDGGRYFIPDVPRISPDRRMIVAVSASDADYNVNGVFVFHLREGTLSPSLWHEPDEYALYSFLRWKDAQSIALKKSMHADQKNCPGYKLMTVGLVLSQRQGRWKFEPDGSKPQCE